MVGDEWIRENEKRIKGAEVWIEKANTELLNINEIGLHITYEGIYNRGNDIQKVLEYLNIENPKYLHLLNPSNRLRKVSGAQSKPLI